MSTTQTEEAQTEQQRQRRLRKRHCGNCNEPAEEMLPWRPGQSIPICHDCAARLKVPAPPAYDLAEVRPCEEFRLLDLEERDARVVPIGPVDVLVPRASGLVKLEPSPLRKFFEALTGIFRRF